MGWGLGREVPTTIKRLDLNIFLFLKYKAVGQASAGTMEGLLPKLNYF
jgi:hypothetical protein